MAEINMRQIEVFLSVARCQNISKAAKELYTSQSSVSNWIARMEKYCGFQLFERTNRGAVLTPRGEELYARFEIVYHRFRVSVEEICNARPAGPDRIRIGILNRLDTMNAARGQISDFSREHANAPVVEERFNYYELRNKTLCDELDVIFTLSFDLDPCPEFESIPICAFPAYFVIPDGWEERAAGEGGLSILSGKTLIVETTTQRDWAMLICRDHGVVPADIRYVSSYILMSSMISHETGFTVDGKVITDGIYSPDTAFIPVESGHGCNIVMAWKKEDPSPQTMEFVDFVRANVSGITK